MATHHPYDPVEASRQRWIEEGWGDAADGMAAVASVMRAEQIFLGRATTILRPLGLTFARYQVLGMLRWTGPITLGAVGRGLWITPGTVTSSVDRLEAADLCRRVPHATDARVTLVEITAKGRQVFDRAVERLNAELFGTVELSPAELDLLISLIGKLRAAEGDDVTVNTSTPITGATRG
ncbi:MAG: MarR family transcriptional regulator [Actinomycetota bacterium]|nr:MarR family transcriptional regulator [Actinomycetota bacterium]